ALAAGELTDLADRRWSGLSGGERARGLMAATASPRSGDGWEPTLAAALLGADRAPHLPPDALSGPPSGEDAGGALLV
uniref:hypothetical protein n=1 Tax=Acinetobacter baumannii TaxID=470 RepID=UPI001C0A0C01